MRWEVTGPMYEEARPGVGGRLYARRVFESAEEVVDYCFDPDSIDRDLYDEFLDEVYGEVEVCGYTYSSSRLLAEVDSVAYNCGFNDWLDGEVTSRKEDLEWTVNRMDPGDEEDICDFTVVCLEDEPEDDGTNLLDELSDLVGISDGLEE